jgi:hydrophobic/amphiphilic exporter-1 (mainly G- bacteria), HAE1 family
VVVIFPVTFLYGVSKFLFQRAGAVGGAVAVCLLFVAMTVVPLFCAKLIKGHQGGHELGGSPRETPDEAKSWGARSTLVQPQIQPDARRYEGVLNWRCCGRWPRCSASPAFSLLEPGLYPLIGKSYFPRTDPGQFVINVKAPSGTRLELTDNLVGQVEEIVREVVPKRDLKSSSPTSASRPGFPPS